MNGRAVPRRPAVRSSERLLALLAVLLLPAALRIFSLARVLRFCDRWPVIEDRRHAPHALGNRVRRWMAHGRGPWESTCLTRSIVLYALLRQHGYAPRFVLGVEGGAADFTAHAWVAIADLTVSDPRDAVAG